MVKQFDGVYLFCVRIAQITDGVMKNKTVFLSKFWRSQILLC